LEEGEGTVVDGQSGGEAGSPGATDGDGGTTDGAITEEGGSDRPDEAVSSGAIDAGATSDGAISADATTDGAVTAEATSEAAIAAAVFTFISLSVDDSLRYYDNNGDPVEFEVVLNDEASGLSYSVFLGAAPVRLKIPEGVYSVERGVFAPLGYKVAQISPQHFAVSNGVCYIDGEIVGSIEISVDYELSGKRYFAIERSCYYIMMTRGGSERRRAAEINTEPTAEEGATSAPESDATPEPATPEQPEPTGGEAAAADGGTDGAEPDVGAGGTAAPAGPPAPASPTAPEGGVKPIPISAVPPNARHIEDLYQKLLSHDYP
jgi:hypothetical protein